MPRALWGGNESHINIKQSFENFMLENVCQKYIVYLIYNGKCADSKRLWHYVQYLAKKLSSERLKEKKQTGCIGLHLNE